jgi:hypothetical protein
MKTPDIEGVTLAVAHARGKAGKGTPGRISGSDLAGSSGKAEMDCPACAAHGAMVEVARDPKERSKARLNELRHHLTHLGVNMGTEDGSGEMPTE